MLASLFQFFNMSNPLLWWLCSVDTQGLAPACHVVSSRAHVRLKHTKFHTELATAAGAGRYWFSERLERRVRKTQNLGWGMGGVEGKGGECEGWVGGGGAGQGNTLGPKLIWVSALLAYVSHTEHLILFTRSSHLSLSPSSSQPLSLSNSFAWSTLSFYISSNASGKGLIRSEVRWRREFEAKCTDPTPHLLPHIWVNWETMKATSWFLPSWNNTYCIIN